MSYCALRNFYIYMSKFLCFNVCVFSISFYLLELEGSTTTWRASYTFDNIVVNSQTCMFPFFSSKRVSENTKLKQRFESTIENLMCISWVSIVLNYVTLLKVRYYNLLNILVQHLKQFKHNYRHATRPK